MRGRTASETRSRKPQRRSALPVGEGRAPEPARHELPEIDTAALTAALAAERALQAAQQLGVDRWIRFLAPIPDQLRDGSLRDVRIAARNARAAYGPKDSIRDALPWDVTEALLGAVDRLRKQIARYEANRD